MVKLEAALLSIKVAMKPQNSKPKKTFRAQPTFTTVAAGLSTPSTFAVSSTPFFPPGSAVPTASQPPMEATTEVPTVSGDTATRNCGISEENALLSDVLDLQEQSSGVNAVELYLEALFSNPIGEDIMGDDPKI